MLSWIIWNPSRDVFTIPFIERSIGWYGICFALGFLLGYYLILYFFKRFLCAYPLFSEGSVSWPGLLSSLQKKEDNPQGKVIRDLFFKLTPCMQKALVRVPIEGKIPRGIKKQVIETLNQLLADKEYFHCLAFAQVGNKKILDFARNRVAPKTLSLLKCRLCLEAVFPTVFIPLSRRAVVFCERIAIHVMIGTVIGARLGHLLFYETWSSFAEDPLVVFRTWEGGLASHGGVIGILIALSIFFWKIRRSYPMMDWVRLIDFLVVPSAFAAVFIRIGNFFNQEILGKSTLMPWGIVFMQPADGSAPIPRHPAQLYEALFYLAVFGILFLLWKRHMFSWSSGKASGLFFILIFTFRFAIEFLKEEQSNLMGAHSSLVMGQYLSIPMVLLGIILWNWGHLKKRLYRLYKIIT